MVWPELAHGVPHEVGDLGAGAGVEVAGGLVGEDDLGPAGQRGPRRRAAAARRTARSGGASGGRASADACRRPVWSHWARRRAGAPSDMGA